MYSKFTGIILKKHPLGEADELLTIYTRELGKMRVKAISTRKPISRLGGQLQSLNEIEFETANRAVTSHTGLPILISARARAINAYLRQNLRKFAYALVGIETIYRLTPDYQENLDAYASLSQFLNDLGERSDEEIMVRAFQLRLLSSCGYAFDPAMLPFETHLSDEAVIQLNSLAGGKFSGRLALESERVIDRFIDFVLEREIKSVRFLDNLT